MSYVDTVKDLTGFEGYRWSKKSTLVKGSKYTNITGIEVEVVRHMGRNFYECILEGEGLRFSGVYLKSGKFRTPLDPRIYNRGFIGFGDFNPQDNKDAYHKWQSLFKRCYSGLEHYRSYNETDVCKEWYNFQNFCKWFYKNNKKGFDLDKDLKAKNFKGDLYSPETCLFLPKDINVLVSKVEYHSATKEGGKYRARVDFSGKGVELGRFSDKNNALWIKRVAKIGFIEQRLRESRLGYLLEYLNYEF